MNLLQCTSHSPWKAEFGRSGWCVLSARGEGVAYVRQDMIHGESNARLIASAPDLLRALEQLLETAESLNDWLVSDGSINGEHELFKKVRAIISKAKGEA